MNNLASDPGSSLVPVTPEVAQAQTLAWRQFINPTNGPEFKARAFYIRVEDVLCALRIPTTAIDPNISGMRVYMALDDQSPDPFHLFVVGTDNNKDDIIFDAQGGSAIFDTTMPCPTLCGTPNILNGLLAG